MKCDIIRDLLPGYIDDLTSETSNAEIEEHLKECEECRKYLEAMKKEMVSERFVEKTKEKVQVEIQPFKKLRKEMWKRAIIIAFSVLFTAGILGTIYEGLYGGGTQANADDVEITYEKNDGIVSVGFRSTDDSKYIDVLGGTYEKDETGDEVYKWNSIQPVVYRVSPFENQKGYEQGIFVFLDENTILDKNGKILEVTGEEVLEIEFADGTKEIKIQDLYKGNSIQQLK